MTWHQAGGRSVRRAIAAWLALFIVWGVAAAATDEQGPPPATALVLVATIEGAIGPPASKHVGDAIAAAQERRADVLVLRLNTPGGLVTTTRQIITDILEAPLPVIGYVSPPGAHAASAGTYILYATHLAAMAPGTNVGAATPVQLGGSRPLPGDKEQPENAEEPADGNEPVGDAMANKAINDAVAFIRSLAEMRGRNAEWAERAVREAVSLSAAAAREEGVIDFVAADLEDVLAQADGRTVSVGKRDVTLATAGADTETFEPSWLTELLAIITNPNIAFILLLIGVYGLIFEFSNPGTIGPGVVGVTCLILGLYALNLLPLNYAGLTLIVVGIACMVAEAFVPSFGILGIGGLVAFVLGAMLLFETDLPAYQLSWPVIAGSALVSGGLLIFVLGYVWRAHQRPVVTGTGRFVGQKAEVVDWSDTTGHVRLAGERWRAEGPAGLVAGDVAVVRKVRGLTLIVGAANGNNREENP